MLCYTSQNLGEFWNTCTRPAEFNGDGLSIEEADDRAATIEKALNLLTDGPQCIRVAKTDCELQGFRRESSRCEAGGRNVSAWGQSDPDF